MVMHWNTVSTANRMLSKLVIPKLGPFQYPLHSVPFGHILAGGSKPQGHSSVVSSDERRINTERCFIWFVWWFKWTCKCDNFLSICQMDGWIWKWLDDGMTTGPPNANRFYVRQDSWGDKRVAKMSLSPATYSSCLMLLWCVPWSPNIYLSVFSKGKHTRTLPYLQLVPLSADCWPPNLIMEREAVALFCQSLNKACDHRWRSVRRSMAEFRALLCGVAHFCHHASTTRHWYASKQPVSLPIFSTHDIWKLTILSYPIFPPNSYSVKHRKYGCFLGFLFESLCSSLIY